MSGPKNKTCGCEGKCDCDTTMEGGTKLDLDKVLDNNHPGRPLVDAVTEE